MNLGTVVKIVHHLESLLNLLSTERISENVLPKFSRLFQSELCQQANAASNFSFLIVQILKEDTINRKLYLIRRRLKDKLLPKSENQPTDRSVLLPLGLGLVWRRIRFVSERDRELCSKGRHLNTRCGVCNVHTA